MSPFEYITVLVSIILGLGIAQIVTGLAHFLHGSNQVKLYWPHLLWIIMIFFFHIQEWWVFYEYKSFTAWKLPIFIFVILYPILLFVQARLLFPFENFNEVTDLKKFYYQNYRLFFGSVAIQVALSIIDNLWLRGLGIGDQIVQLTIGPIMLAIAVFKIKNERIHQVLSILLLLSVVIAIVVNQDVWKIE